MAETENIGLTDSMKKYVIKLIKMIARDKNLEEQDQVLMFMLLDTEDKAKDFASWIMTQIKDNKLMASQNEIMAKVSSL